MKLSLLTTALGLLSSCLPSVLAGPTPATRHRRWNTGFVSTEGKQFKLDGADFTFRGTNAYWLFLLNEDVDVVKTLALFSKQGIKVVRVWAFREVVGQPPAFGNFTNIWTDGSAKCSDDGVARLKLILDAAQQHDIKVIFSLTNNWSPSTPNDANRPPGYFSNENGGIDTYVQQIHPGGDHDLFYTDGSIFSAFQDTLRCIIPPFKDHPALFSWELANDLRCQGASGRTTSSSCDTKTITEWVHKTAKFVKSLDSNHLVGAGDGGFLCTQSSCHKVNRSTPPPTVSQSAGNSKKRRRSFLTSRDVLSRFRKSEKDARSLVDTDSGKKLSVRGGWSAPADISARHDGTLGSAFDGSQGVDSEDICNDKYIDFCNFQLFPDQNFYGVGKSKGSGFTSASVSQVINFILNQADVSESTGKPVLNAATGITSTAEDSTLENFDTSHIGQGVHQSIASPTQQLDAFEAIIAASTSAGINGFLSFQRGATGEHSVKGSIIDDSHPALPGAPLSFKRAPGGAGRTPNNGYGMYPPGSRV